MPSAIATSRKNGGEIGRRPSLGVMAAVWTRATSGIHAALKGGAVVLDCVWNGGKREKLGVLAGTRYCTVRYYLRFQGSRRDVGGIGTYGKHVYSTYFDVQ